MIVFRSDQVDIMNYKGGTMGIQAVPGAGKTFIITHLVVNLLEDMVKNEDQGKILILTYMNSAVNNFQTRIRKLIEDKDIPRSKFEVMTIHSLALSIIMDNTDIAFIDENIMVIDDYMKNIFLDDAINEFRDEFLLNKKFDPISSFIKKGFENAPVSKYNKKTNIEDWEAKFRNIVSNAIKMMKYECLEDEFMLKKVSERKALYSKLYSLKDKDMFNHTGIFNILVPIYHKYQEKLRNNGYMDYDDILLLAYKILSENEDVRRVYQKRYKYIFEDECQDSNLLQGKIIDMISLNITNQRDNVAGSVNFNNSCISKDRVDIEGRELKDGSDMQGYRITEDKNIKDDNDMQGDRYIDEDKNIKDDSDIQEYGVYSDRDIYEKSLFERNLVRIGDVNQSITGTFTGSDPSHFMDFFEKANFQYNMDMSSRCSKDVIDLANYLVYLVNIGGYKKSNKSDDEIEKMFGSYLSVVNKSNDYFDSLVPIYMNEVTKGVGYKENPIMPYYAIDTLVPPDYVKNNELRNYNYKNIADEIIKIKRKNSEFSIGVLCFSNFDVEELSGVLDSYNIDYTVLGGNNEDKKKVISDVRSVIDFLINTDDIKYFKSMFRSVFLDRVIEDIKGNKMVERDIDSIVDDVNNYFKNVNVEKWIFDDNYYFSFKNKKGDDSISSNLSMVDELKRIVKMDRCREILSDICNYPQINPTKLIKYIVDKLDLTNEEQLLCRHLFVYVDNLVKYENADLMRVSVALDKKYLRVFDNSIDSIYEYEDSDPEAGSVTISTLHKSKGMEWDACIISDISRYTFPSSVDDYSKSIVKYLKDNYNCPDALIKEDLDYFLDRNKDMNFNSVEEKKEYYTNYVKREIINERLRLLYVGITRAKKILVLSGASKPRSYFFDSLKIVIDEKKHS